MRFVLASLGVALSLLGCGGTANDTGTREGGAQEGDSITTAEVDSAVSPLTTAPARDTRDGGLQQRDTAEDQAMDEVQVGSFVFKLLATPLTAVTTSLEGDTAVLGTGPHAAPYVCYRVQTDSALSYMLFQSDFLDRQNRAVIEVLWSVDVPRSGAHCENQISKVQHIEIGPGLALGISRDSVRAFLGRPQPFSGSEEEYGPLNVPYDFFIRQQVTEEHYVYSWALVKYGDDKATYVAIGKREEHR